jgi:hypothetical protein
MNPTIQESPISVLLGLGLLDGRLSLIETCIGGTGVCVAGLAMKISCEIRIESRLELDMDVGFDFC